MHLESLSNGLGAQSMLLFLMGLRREIPATFSTTADTGWESDRLWSNGRRASAKTYFDEVVMPLSIKWNFPAYFVRAVDEDKQPLPTLLEHTKWCVKVGKLNNLKIPLFGSRKGRRTQVCTGKWKVRAINQQLRRMGAKTACTFQGIHAAESSRRVSGRYIRQHSERDWISVYQDTSRRSVKLQDGTKIKVEVDVKWLTHAYPLVDLGHNRYICQTKIIGEGIPYLLSSECDGCPHKDLTRWERTSPEVLTELSGLEALFNGEFFFTSKRIPLLEAIEAMRSERAANPEKYKVEADFGCQNAICGV
jgi:hypothetical protein